MVKPLSPRAQQDLENNLAASVKDARSKLGALEPWQVTVFEREVVAEYRRFIRQYRQAGNQTLVDVDVDAIKRYLAYRAPDSASIAISVVADAECVPCVGAVPGIKKLYGERMARRGFKVVQYSAADLGVELEQRATWASASSSLAHAIRSKGQTHALIVQAARAEPDAIDAAHADEEHYQIRTLLMGPSNGVSKELKSDLTLDLAVNDTFAVSSARILTDNLTEMGGQVLLALRAGDASVSLSEVLVQVSGVRDYRHAGELKVQLIEYLKDMGTPVERQLSRGKIMFAVRTRRTQDDIKKVVAALSSSDATVQWEIK